MSKAEAAGAIINLDDINQINVLYQALGGRMPETLSFRYNPGNLKNTGVNSIIGAPEDAKFGVPVGQLEATYRKAQKLGVKNFGIHTMVASNELDARLHITTAELLFAKVSELTANIGISFDFANLGGGLGIPYKPEDKPLDYAILEEGIRQAYQTNIIDRGLKPLQVMAENGRHVTGPNGILVATVRGVKDSYRTYVGVDANMAHLMRPGMYDAYHHVTVLGKSAGQVAVQSIVGDLCENNDQFAKDRVLPVMQPGDIVAIHDTGAHGHAMGFNYNGKTRSAEYLLRPDDSIVEIRRAETRKDLFATLDHPGPVK